MNGKWIDEREAAQILGKSVSWMQRMRWMGAGPAYAKIGRNVRYSDTSLDQYVGGCVVGTADQPCRERD